MSGRSTIVQVLLLLSIVQVSQSQDTCPCEAFDLIEASCAEFAGCGNTLDLQQNSASGAELNHWPYLISLQLQLRNKGQTCFSHFCSGVLIAPNLVLSAAHCFSRFVDGFEGEPRFSIYAAQAPPCRHLGSGEKADTRTNTNYIHIYQGFDQTQAFGDLVIIVLNQSLPGPYPVLPTQNTQIEFNTSIETMGWTGMNPEERSNKSLYNIRQLSYSKSQYVAYEICRNALGMFDSDVGSELLDYETVFCAFDSDADPCGKDGPAVVKGSSPAEDIILGIRSWSPIGYCSNKYNFSAPLVYSRTSAFLSWIDEVVSMY